MKIIDFPGNTRTCNFSYHKVKDGPNYFVCYYKGASRLLYDPLSAWRTLEMAKHTDTGKALKAWCLEVAGEPEVAAAKEEPVKKPMQIWGGYDPSKPEHAWHFEEEPVKKPTFSEESVQARAEYDPDTISVPQLLGEICAVMDNDNTRMVI